MCLVFNARDATHDVDGWFTEPQVVRDATRRVAQELESPAPFRIRNGSFPRTTSVESEVRPCAIWLRSW
jgi:hypothetical protein